MKKEILTRIKELGGNIDHADGGSIEDDLKSIKFNTVLYPKTENTPWSSKHDSEPIYGIGDFIDQHINLFQSDATEFYNKILNKYYQYTEESFGQVFFKHDIFTPFKKGSDDYDEWKGEWNQGDIRKVVVGGELVFMIIGTSYGYPDTHFICLTDPDSKNPMVYATDTDTYFDDITKIGTLEDYFNSFLSKHELLVVLKNTLR